MSVTGISYAGNGNFNMTVNGKTQTFNLADLNTMLRMEQVATYDQQIADQLTEIQSTNQKRKMLNQLMSKMRQYKSEGRDDDYAHASSKWQKDADAAGGTSVESKGHGKTSDTFKLEGSDGTARSMQGWMNHLGIESTDVAYNAETSKRDGQWDTNINNLKSAIDNITSDSEMQMLRFRQMVDKRGTALQEAKTTLTNDKRLKDAIIQG